MTNKWNSFVKEHRKEHPSKSYKQCLIDCKNLYREHGRAGQSQQGTGIIDRVANALLSTKENKLMAGEKHQMIKMPDGRIAPAAYSGAGTQLETRIRRGDKPLSYVDTTAQAHDLRYQLAKNEADIKIADEKMIRNLNKAKAENLDNLFNIRQAELIKVKYLLQDKFGLPTSWFTSFGLDSIKDPTIIPIMQAKLKELEQQGFGKQKRKIY
jgi:Phospholipase A2-like domain